MANLVDGKFWRGRKVFLTGHTGFKGSWLSLWLQDLGAVVTGYSLPDEDRQALFERTGAAAGMTDLRGDICDLPKLTEAIVRAEPSVVLHLAAQSLVRESYRDPIGTLATNVMGTAHVCDAVRAANAKSPVDALLVVTTDKCYENREWLWPYRETDALGGHDLYSSSKACAELVLGSYRASFAAHSGRAIAMATARSGNVIGGGDWAADRLVPDAMRAFATGKVLTLRNPSSTRPWQHVLDPLAGYLLLAQQLVEHGGRFAEAWNFGPDTDADVPVSRIADLLVHAWGRDAKWEAVNDGGPHEAGLLKLDSSKARARLHWRPRLPLPRAIDLTVNWYLEAATRDGAELRDFTLSQIRLHQAQD
jgi:CDP-glucose 4,6-dehydratase